MRPADLWRHSSFRLALGVTLFILTALILASGVGYGLMQGQLTARQDARVTEIFAAIEQTSLEGDEADLVEAIAARIKASPDRSTAYLLKDGAGRVLAGNIRDAGLAPGWSTVAASHLGVETDYPYRMFSGQAGPYNLTVGLTNADLDDLREIVLGAFGWAALFALLGTISVGTVLAARVQKRLSQAEDAAARVAQGDLSARLPVLGRGDDLDRISIAINLSLARLEGSVEAMRQVSADIAHDLRTPLNRLRIRIETASARLEQGLPVEDDLAAATAESDRINEIFSALLRIAQIESGARRENFRTLDLAALMRDVADVYAEVAEDAGQILRPDAEGSAPVMGDRELLTQAFANLIENAIRHCPPGTVITCAVTETLGQVTASVRDTGPGIPAGERDKVLRRLYRLEKSRTTEGTGLGLALVKAVADLHGASLVLGDAAPGLRVDLKFHPIVGAI
ncbi:MAG TPA: ATP-binding protein [Albidovulum sp.]|uniref:sensor histidine kinase n=1 Tax=Albidovulum sp. TaxID=1872424 RepID=UPI002CD3BF1E|nr:ATP-binding protein [Albidovulum sp.]